MGSGLTVNYDLLPTYQAELLRVVPGSIVEIDIEEDDNGYVCFSRSFVALRPCIVCMDVGLIFPWMPHI